MNSALIVVDMQNDFVSENGALTVPKAREIIPVIRRLVIAAAGNRIPVFFTMDWHETNDKEFSIGGWPKHCVRGTRGAEIVKELAFISTGCELVKSTHYDKFHGSNLKVLLDEKGVKKLFFAGVATEYCVRYTALAALKHGFEVFIVKDAIKPINEQHSAKVLEELGRRGSKIISGNAALEAINQNP